MSIDLHLGDCLDVLATLSAGSARCCVTSPPYYGLRSYLPDGHADKPREVGLDATPADYVARLVEVFRGVRRVLADDGTLWLNLGDSYGSGEVGRHDKDTIRAVDARSGRRPNAMTYATDSRGVERRTVRRAGTGLAPKQLLGIPWRVAFALQADGWYLRSDIIWHKPNPMPESVRDRPTKAHEYLFLLSKRPTYFYDHEAIKEDAVCAGANAKRVNAGRMEQEADPLRFRTRPMGRTCGYPERRNRRSVWTIATRAFSGAHFATFPPALVEPCILAGSAPGDTVLDPFCGSGTTLAVAAQHGRSGVGIDLNADYLALARRRLAGAPAA